MTMTKLDPDRTYTLEEVFGEQVVVEAKQIVGQARQRLSFREMVYGARLFATPCVYTADVERMAADGVYIYVNPAFVHTVTKQQLVGIFVHELLHIILLHPFRLERVIKAFMKQYGLDRATTHLLANWAMDYCINPMVLADGFKLPDWVLNDPKYKGRAFEEVMHMLVKDPAQLEAAKQQAAAGEAGAGVGDVLPYPGDEEETKLAEDAMRGSVRETLMSAKACGKEPGWADTLLREWAEAQVDWREELHSYADGCVGPKQESDWNAPHRRYMQMGMYLPRKRQRGVQCMIATCDVSGSVSDKEAHVGLSEIADIMANHQPEEAQFIQFTTKVLGEPDVYRPGDEFPDRITRRGSGGTDFKPQFSWVKKQGLKPSLLICITDGGAPWPEDPGYPVIWLMTTNKVAPWGKTINLKVGSS